MKKLIFFIFSLFLFSTSFSQNYFAKENLLKFADFLFLSGNYKMAADEYERIVFSDSTDNFSKMRLIESYKLLNNYEKSIELSEKYFVSKNDYSAFSEMDYSKLLIKNKNYDKAFNYVRNTAIADTAGKNDLMLNTLLLQAKWKESYSFMISNKVKNVELMNLTMEVNFMKRKSPALASVMSAVLPGAGKAYCGRWKDGLIALLFVAGNSWQAYRGFSRGGIKSYYGWIFAGLSVGFYGGNIYGSFVSAKRYNLNLNTEKVKHAETIFNSTF